MKVTFHCGKPGTQISRSHNNRENAPEHADKARQGNNIVLVDKDLKEFLTDALRDAVRAFNDKCIPKHPDRTKSLDRCVREGMQKAREIIIQVGDMNNQMSDDDYKELYQNIIKDFETNNPNFRVFGAYIHFDETTPHIHLDFVPIADKTRGLTKDVSLEGALKNMGYKDTGKYAEHAFQQWLDHTREHLEEYARSFSVGRYDIEEHTPRTRENIARHREKWQNEIDELKEIKDGLLRALENARDEAERQQIMADINDTMKAYGKADVVPVMNEPTEKGKGGVVNW